jgi:molybdopterin molybdotransferase
VITVKKAETFVLSQAKNFGTEKIELSNALNRVLAENILADRPYPPFNRSTMDGIAIRFQAFQKGIRSFEIVSVVSAGQKPEDIKNAHECVKIMTGAAVPSSCDTIIPVEDIKIEGKNAVVVAKSIKKGQFVHIQGIDKRKGSVVLEAGTIITPEIIPVLASVGQISVTVSKLPKIAVITTGDELVDIDKKPNEYQIRRSNDLAISACLSAYKIRAQLFHVEDDKNKIRNVLKKSLQEFDVIILSGGVSKGEFDYVYQVLEGLHVKKIFHGIAQKPGKPMWFGKSKRGTVVFALPGNPVSSFLCVNRYVLPYLKKSLGLQSKMTLNTAILTKDTASNPSLTLFTQASLETDKKGKLLTTPLSHHGSGDFIGVAGADVFVELPPQKGNYTKGSICKIWPIKSL